MFESYRPPPIEHATAVQFAIAHGRLWRALRRRSDRRLSQSERLLLDALSRAGVSLMWVAERLELPKSTASATVKALEQRDLLIRARDPLDGRKLAIVLTKEGLRLVRGDTALELELVTAILRDVPRPRRHALVRLLQQLAERAERIDSRRL